VAKDEESDYSDSSNENPDDLINQEKLDALKKPKENSSTITKRDKTVKRKHR